MILPARVMKKVETWNGLEGGSARCSTGSTTNTAAANRPMAVQPPRPVLARKRTTNGVRISGLGEAALEGEQPLGALLDENDDGRQHHDLGDHRPGPALQELADDAQAQGRRHRAGELADAA